MLIRLHSKAKGDIVTIKEDDWKWGKKEVPPNFVTLDFTDVEVSGMIEYLDPGPSGLKRKWKIDYNNLPLDLQDKLLGLDNDKSKKIKIDATNADITWLDFRQYIINKETGETEEDKKKKKPKTKSK